jgi:hypothetical protein
LFVDPRPRQKPAAHAACAAAPPAHQKPAGHCAVHVLDERPVVEPYVPAGHAVATADAAAQ